MAGINREVKLRSWGNSKAVRLTKDVLEEAGINEIDNVVFELAVETHKITLIRKSELTPFQKLFANYNGGKPQPEALWDEVESVCKEL